MENEKTQWYSNKALFEQIEELKEQISHVCTEIGKTTTLLRDYNGIRKRLNEIELWLSEQKGKEKNETESKENSAQRWAYIFGAGGLFIALLAVLAQVFCR